MTSPGSSKTEFSCIFYDVFDVGGYAGSSRLEVSLLCFDATRLTLSNKLEFAQFGAHMKKLWQFWFSPCGSTAVAAVVPLVASSGSTAPTRAVVLLEAEKQQFPTARGRETVVSYYRGQIRHYRPTKFKNNPTKL